ncbi:aldehyde dehydrogenase [Striga asiatica]|uniref:Aldehyde dehydrogenase n=1 Tax=Striga asiatica TaxID=4170 RepID=A0A5A7PCJ0_STRAF|nr:aldehyde dehydrogenase [Striga asiatica]
MGHGTLIHDRPESVARTHVSLLVGANATQWSDAAWNSNCLNPLGHITIIYPEPSSVTHTRHHIPSKPATKKLKVSTLCAESPVGLLQYMPNQEKSEEKTVQKPSTPKLVLKTPAIQNNEFKQKMHLSIKPPSITSNGHTKSHIHSMRELKQSIESKLFSKEESEVQTCFSTSSPCSNGLQRLSNAEPLDALRRRAAVVIRHLCHRAAGHCTL